jgi:hypothetical protein
MMASAPMTTDAPSRLEAQRSFRSFIWPALALAALWAMLRIVFFEGFWGADDYGYIRYARNWNHPAESHLQARLLFTGLLHVSMKLFGCNPFAWAAPALAGSLILLLSVSIFAYVRYGVFAMLACGALAASLPVDINNGTVASANPLAVGLASAATCLAIGKGSTRGAILAGIAGGLAILSHPATVFYVLALAVGISFSVGRARAIALAILALAIYIGGELMLSTIINGDPWADFRILRDWRDPDMHYRLYSPGWFLYPVETFFFSKDFAILPALACFIGFTQRRSPVFRALAIALVASWLWVGYGSAKPTSYEPLWRLTRFQYPAVTAMVLLCGVTLARKRWISVTIALVGLNVCLVAASGSYGQATKISREMLQFAQHHPDDQFLTDYFSLREMSVYAGVAPTPNIAIWDSASNFANGARPLFVMFNPLNNQWTPLPNRPNYKPPSGLPKLCYGPPVMKTAVEYRVIAWILPNSIRNRSSWFVRRPAGTILPVFAAEKCASAMSLSR